MSENTDLALLERYEPVLRFTNGEDFIPIDIWTYLQECSLWISRPGKPAECIVLEGEISPETLCQLPPDDPRSVFYLKFIEPLNLPQLAEFEFKRRMKELQQGRRFRPTRGRLARVGYLARFVDALFSVSLLARGRVPAATAASAIITMRRLQESGAKPSYYGRVVRQAGWTILQYWFFFPYNNWRSGFYGVNDHEGDWEMVSLFLDHKNEAAGPVWVAYANHESKGADQRRRWDDPEVEKVEQHPVVYVGAGSHAAYFAAGEYLAKVEIPAISPWMARLRRVEQAYERTMRRLYASSDTDWSEQAAAVLRVPFVDYARGDGFAIGPQTETCWGQREIISDQTDWVQHFRGLWGLYAHDPVSGENAPAGPRYNRDGSVRQSWYDPLSWAELAHVPPPSEALFYIENRIAAYIEEAAGLESFIQQEQSGIHQLGLQTSALQDQPHQSTLLKLQKSELERRSEVLDESRGRLANITSMVLALKAHAKRIKEGWQEPVRSHLHHPATPETEQTHQLGIIAEIWAAISVGLVMVGVIGIYLLARPAMLWGTAILIALIVVLEMGFRGRLDRLITDLTTVLAAAGGVVLLFEFFWPLVFLLTLGAGAYIMIENLREIWE